MPHPRLAVTACVLALLVADGDARPTLLTSAPQVAYSRVGVLPNATESQAAALPAKRQAAGTASTAAAVPFCGFVPAAGAVSLNGLPYPAANAVPPETSLPQAWVDRYNERKAAGAIPDIAASVLDASGVPVYPSSVSTDTICAWAYDLCTTGDISLAPAGTIALTVDDGPTTASQALVEFARQQAQPLTHFLIGSNVLSQPDAMSAIAGHDLSHLAVHTWSHSLQTPLSDLQIVGELGWSMQILYDWTGRLPLYWRPPQGDIDNRVRAIAREVFGLQSTLWSAGADANDWCLQDPILELDPSAPEPPPVPINAACEGVTYDSVVQTYQSWLAANASSQPLAGRNVLMHELTSQSVLALEAFQASILASQYVAGSVASVTGRPWYQNQLTPTDPIETVASGSVIPTRAPMDWSEGGGAIASSAALGDYASLPQASLAGTGAPSVAAAGTTPGADAAPSTGVAASAQVNAASMQRFGARDLLAVVLSFTAALMIL